ncbi:uracil-DNA glycosylase [Sphingomonas oligophenolica]|uniref:Uracil-DNA glycosylase n=1 Tax=Sphingomonas oligophenolica TaxID=301154 RepID=A0A502CL32_9SPHN|nr:uracil-DNA glycosylase [Sphingomonas oligophenolica]TPG12486.1 uracil-DNA glycosylase [Sphingomonas oligophenolica]
MGADQHFDFLGHAASALDWWADAGVDMLVDDAPRDWLAPPEPAAVPAAGGHTPPRADASAIATGALPDTVPATLPDTLEAFAAWRSSADAPESAWRGPFLGPTGPADAAIMIVVDCPDPDDAHGGHLLSGSVGKLFDRMLAAIGLARDAVYLVPVCAKRPIAGRMPREVEARLGDIARHHVRLATPKRVLCLGNAASRAITGTEMPASRGLLHGFNHRGGNIGVVASFHPRLLLEKPALKAEAWKDLQLLMGNLT